MAVRVLEGRFAPTEDPLWRYMSLPVFIRLLSSGLSFARLDQHDDRYEGRLDHTVEDTWNGRWVTEHGPGLIEQARVRGADEGALASSLEVIERVKAGDLGRSTASETLVSSWQQRDDESMVMWDSYARRDGDLGICVVTSVDRLRKTLESLDEAVWRELRCERPVMGRTVYPVGDELTDLELLSSIDEQTIAFVKRRAFEDEREFRVTLAGREERVDLPLHAAMPLGDAIERILVSPRAQEFEVAAVCDVVREFAPDLIDRVAQSSLLEPPT